MKPRRVSEDSHWHLDKRVPITLIVAILGQTAGLGWFAASITERVTNLERRAVVTEPQAERITRLEVGIEVLKDGVSEIKRLVQQRR